MSEQQWGLSPVSLWSSYSLKHLSYGFMDSCVYHRSIMKDGEVLDGWLGLYAFGLHARFIVGLLLSTNVFNRGVNHFEKWNFLNSNISIRIFFVGIANLF